MFLIVGLGNPGKEFEKTRHNIGFEVISELSKRNNISLAFKKSLKSIIGRTDLDGNILIVAMPQTFMNLSGEAVAEIKKHHRINAENITVIHDDLDLEPGTVKIKKGGGTAGHNGLESILASLGTGDFIRVRIGVGRSKAMASKKISGADYVLSRIPKNQAVLMKEAVVLAAEASEEIIIKGLNAAMNRFNRPSR